MRSTEVHHGNKGLIQILSMPSSVSSSQALAESLEAQPSLTSDAASNMPLSAGKVPHPRCDTPCENGRYSRFQISDAAEIQVVAIPPADLCYTVATQSLIKTKIRNTTSYCRAPGDVKGAERPSSDGCRRMKAQCSSSH